MADQLQKRSVHITPSKLKLFKSADLPNVPKATLLEGLVGMGLVLKGAGNTRALDQTYIPVFRTKVALEDLLPYKDRDRQRNLQEEYDVSGFVRYMHGCVFRKENALVLARTLKDAAGRAKKGRGRQTQEVANQKEMLLERGAKLEDAEKSGDKLIDALCPQAADPAQKRRRLTRKQTTIRTLRRRRSQKHCSRCVRTDTLRPKASGDACRYRVWPPNLSADGSKRTSCRRRGTWTLPIAPLLCSTWCSTN